MTRQPDVGADSHKARWQKPALRTLPLKHTETGFNLTTEINIATGS